MERQESTRIVVTVLLAPVFLLALPLGVGVLGRRLDRRLQLPVTGPAAGARVLGAALAGAGFALGLWSVTMQIDRGRGTPLPPMPTQVLLTDGPYRICRNPMTLGAIAAYLGIAIAARTPAGVGLVTLAAAGLIAYLKGLEEQELAERFGPAYLEYRRTTPFIIPRLELPARHPRAG